MENKTNLIIGLGALVFLLPFFGLPQFFDHILYVLSGLVLVGVGISSKLKLKNENSPKETGTFEENGMYGEELNDKYR